MQQPTAAGSLHQLAELRGVPLQGLGLVKGKGLTGIRKRFISGFVLGFKMVLVGITVSDPGVFCTFQGCGGLGGRGNNAM